MTILPHVLVGAAVASYTNNIPVAVVAGITSHFIIDYIPHYNPPMRRKDIKLWVGLTYFVEYAVSAVILYFLARTPAIFWGAVAGMLVDIDNFIHILEKVGVRIHSFGSVWHRTTSVRKGLFNETVVIIVGSIWLYLRLQS